MVKIEQSQQDEIKRTINEAYYDAFESDRPRIEIDLESLSDRVDVGQREILGWLTAQDFIDDHYPETGKDVEIVVTIQGVSWINN